MLNDLAGPTRLYLASIGLTLGLVLGGLVTYDSLEHETAMLFLLPLAGVLFVMVSIGWVVFLRRAERRFRDVLTTASAELAAGTVVGHPTAARVVRRRIDQRRGWALPGRGVGPGPSVVLVLTALATEGPRRVAAVVPAALGLELRKAPAVVLLHPTHREVAVVDDRITRDQLAAVDGDPRWASERLPTDRTVVGGYLALVGAMVVGALVGATIAASVVALAP